MAYQPSRTFDRSEQRKRLSNKRYTETLSKKEVTKEQFYGIQCYCLAHGLTPNQDVYVPQNPDEATASVKRFDYKADERWDRPLVTVPAGMGQTARDILKGMKAELADPRAVAGFVSIEIQEEGTSSEDGLPAREKTSA